MHPTRINNKGDIVGFFGDSADGPFLYRQGKVYDLLTPGDRTEVGSMTINDRGVIAGTVYNSPTPSFILPAFGPGDDLNLANARTLALPGFAAWDMNDHGAIIGSIFEPGQTIPRAEGVYQDGHLSELPSLVPGEPVSAIDINNRGQIIGETRIRQRTDGSYRIRAVIWSNGGIENLGALAGFLHSTGTAINDHGEAVGYCSAPITLGVGWGGFIYRDGVMSKLPSPPNAQFPFPTHINNAGDILIYFSRRNEESAHWLYSKGVFHDLPAIVAAALGRRLSFLYFNDINDRGEIIGMAYYNNGNGEVSQGILLRPQPRSE